MPLTQLEALPRVVSAAPHNDLGNIHRLALQAGNFNDKLAGNIGAQLDRLADAAQLLNVDDLHMLAGSAQLFVHALVVGAFTAKAYD